MSGHTEGPLRRRDLRQSPPEPASTPDRRRSRRPALVAAVLVALAGLAVVVLGVLLATSLAQPRSVTATLVVPADVRVVEAVPGMLGLRGRQVRVEARAVSGRVFVGVGRAADVEAYLGDVARHQVNGVDGAGHLSGRRVDGSASVPDPATVDVWAASVSGDSAVVLRWPDQPGQWRMVAASDGTGPAPARVTLTWTRDVAASPAPAVIAVGALLLVAGAASAMALRLARPATGDARAESW